MKEKMLEIINKQQELTNLYTELGDMLSEATDGRLSVCDSVRPGICKILLFESKSITVEYLRGFADEGSISLWHKYPDGDEYWLLSILGISCGIIISPGGDKHDS